MCLRCKPGLRVRAIANLKVICLLAAQNTAFSVLGEVLPPPASVTSPSIPGDVEIPAGFQGNPITFFDDFSWRSFIALVWPAEQGKRGVADTNRDVSDMAGARVFETFKADWEIFRPGGRKPADWDTIDRQTPCGSVDIGFNDLALASFSKFGNLGQATGVAGQLTGPIVTQNHTYLRYLTAFNRLEFDQILVQSLYL